jgi:hypothetical protein
MISLFLGGKFGAEGGTRTRTSFLATPSRWCVYQIPPLRHLIHHGGTENTEVFKK